MQRDFFLIRSFFIVLLCGVAVWCFDTWVGGCLGSSVPGAFHRVSNRELSVFLWSHPQLMRAHQKRKAAYLPDFEYKDGVAIQRGCAEQFVQAPPELLYHYHQWRRFSWDFPRRTLAHSDFLRFLRQHPEWDCRWWPSAPLGYQELLLELEVNDRSGYVQLLPLDVYQAFVGWKNYYEEGEAINRASYTYGELRAFVHTYPQFERRLWFNLYAQSQPEYLLSLWNMSHGEADIYPREEISPALRVALYNYRCTAG